MLGWLEILASYKTPLKLQANLGTLAGYASSVFEVDVRNTEYTRVHRILVRAYAVFSVNMLLLHLTARTYARY